MNNLQNDSEDFDLEFPDPSDITETGYYEVKRRVNGVEDTLEVLFWSNKDIATAEKNAERHERKARPRTASIS